MSRPAEPVLPSAGSPQGLRALRLLGAALGAAPGPVAAFGQSWAGTGDGRVHVWILATLVGALVGALTYPLFWPAPSAAAAAEPAGAAEPGLRVFGVGFAALFGFAVGLVAGAFTAFPMGAAMGGLGGVVAGGAVALLARLLRRLRVGLLLAWLGGAGVALLMAWVWVR